MTRWKTVVLASVGAALALVVLFGLGGCRTAGPSPTSGETRAESTVRKPLPTYAEAATRYNQRVLPLDRLIATATVRLTYTGKDGERHTEQPDGTIQIVRPRKLAVSLGKGGKKLFWFGSDDQRYWWLDLSDSDDRFAAVGRHERFDAKGGEAGKRLGIAIRPLDLIAAVGVTPLDPKLPGATQWSKDGTRLGIVSPLMLPGDSASEPAGLQRVWVEPATMAPRSIELFDAGRRMVLRADLEGQEPVEITRTGVPGSAGARPMIPAQITCRDVDSGTDIRISLSDAKDGPVSEKAFQLDELLTRLAVERVVDLDEPQAESPPANSP